MLLPEPVAARDARLVRQTVALVERDGGYQRQRERRRQQRRAGEHVA